MTEESKLGRAKNKLLRVTFPDGTTYCYSRAAATLVATLAKIGSDKFPQIKMDIARLPMLSKEIYPQFKDYMKPVCDGWYVNTQPATDYKYIQLRAIDAQLNLGLKVEIGDDFATTPAPQAPKTKKKGTLRVQFPDGEVLESTATTEVFVEAVKKLGLEEVKRKGIMWGSNPIVSTCQANKQQVEAAPGRWVAVPNLLKDKVKLISVIAAMMRVKLDIKAY